VDEQNQALSASAKGDHSSAAVPASNHSEPQRNRCAQCGRPFGLVRRRRAGQQFCSAACMDKQVESVRQAVQDKARWYEFLTRRG
jgi:ribosomal protein S14